MVENCGYFVTGSDDVMIDGERAALDTDVKYFVQFTHTHTHRAYV